MKWYLEELLPEWEWQINLYLGSLADAHDVWWQTLGQAMPQAAIKYQELHDFAHQQGFFDTHMIFCMCGINYNMGVLL
jgi:hypothetical protein